MSHLTDERQGIQTCQVHKEAAGCWCTSTLSIIFISINQKFLYLYRVENKANFSSSFELYTEKRLSQVDNYL